MATQPDRTAEFFGYMEAREEVRILKDSGLPPPWTADPVLERNYFTNVMREMDRDSRWIQANITDPYADHKWLPVMLAAARWLGHVPALAESMEAKGIWPISTRLRLAKLAAELDWQQAQGKQVFGGAYVISANGMRWGDWISKVEYVLRGIVEPALPVLLSPAMRGSIEGATTALDEVPGWGGFMAYEVACDLRWAPGWLDNAPDIHTWGNPGPGARRGLNSVFPDRWGKRGPNPTEALELMRSLMHSAQGWPWQVPWIRPLEMRDIEHSLCEFSKYEKIRNGGRGKRKYPLGSRSPK
jgi:hypothetical protein